MKLLKILVCVLVLCAGYDVVRQLLSRGKGIPSAVEGTTQWESVFGYDKVDIKPSIEWLIGGLCVAVLYVLRQISRWILPRPVDLAKKLRRDDKTAAAPPLRRESFLTCRVSDTTINTYTDDHVYDMPGQLSTAQLQVLLEELKFTVDEKFEEIESWMASNEQEFKLWLKRLERVETELSYIRHQIFILMSSNAKLGSSISIGDVSDSRGHVETLKDLSTILAQVKKQFNEDEAKGKNKKGNGDGKDSVATEEKALKYNAEPVEQKQPLIAKIKEKESESRKNADNDIDDVLDLDELKVNTREILVSVEAKLERNRFPKKTESVESDINSASIDHRDESNSTHQSEKDEVDRAEKLENVSRKSSRQEAVMKSRSLSPPSSRKRESGDHASSRKSSRSPESRKTRREDNTYLEPNNINDESTASTNLISLKYDSMDPLDSIALNVKEDSPRSSSPRRSVRFAQEQRDISPSKTPTWLGIERDQIANSAIETKGVPESKVISSLIELRGNKDMLSCPIVEDKRPSRRTVMEKELNRLERRRASPSPPRTRQSRRSNVRSKVADYIRGNKNI